MVVNRNKCFLLVVFLVFFGLPGTVLLADEAILPASKDNTIYSEGNLSNAVGDHLFSGKTKTEDF